MQTVLEQMLGNYKTNTTEEKKNALKEVVQEVALCGLSRAGFFKHAAFYGGTALRIFMGLTGFPKIWIFHWLCLIRIFNLITIFPVWKANWRRWD